MKVIDLTHVIEQNMPVYPGTEPPLLMTANSYEKDGFKETCLTMFSHTGTHIDAPAHIFANRTTLDAFPAEQFIGKAVVIDCRDLKAGEAITLDMILKTPDVEKVDFLLFDLGWDRYWGTPEYFGDYPCPDDDAMDFIVNGNYKGIGFDVIGLDPVSGDGLKRHKKLFESKDIINVENLCNLDKCGKQPFWFGCFPLKFIGSDGAPARALAWFE